MEIQRQGSEIVITGNIKNTSDYQFIKVIFQDKVSIHVYVKDDRLYSLLEDLNLIETFKVKKY